MGLVFGAIILLWMLMVMIVKITEAKDKNPDVQDSSPDVQDELLRKVAVVAAAIAIAQEDETTPHEFPLPATALVSAWQAVMRTDILSKRGKKR